MIDEKKTEEAANLHRFELIASMHGSTLGTPMQCFKEVVDAETELIENSFITGAKWAINEFLKNLWHPASEEPDVRHKTIICLYEDGDIRQDYDVYDEATESDKLGRDKFNWDYYAEDNKIRNWCYETDLLPKEEGEQ
nr:MAG TPA: hypothetical protein [Caudoviricetes sp.]